MGCPEREGYTLNPICEDAYCEWAAHYEDNGCTCFISPPCGYCTHEGNPSNLEEGDEGPTGSDAVWWKDEPAGIDWAAHKQFMRGL